VFCILYEIVRATTAGCASTEVWNINIVYTKQSIYITQWLCYVFVCCYVWTITFDRFL